MPAKKDPRLDLANRTRALRQRIEKDEHALATAYPDQVERLETDLERERAMFADLDAESEAAVESATDEAEEALERFFSLFSLVSRLHGHGRDAGIKDAFFTRCYTSIGVTQSGRGKAFEAVEPHEVRQVLLNALKSIEAPSRPTRESPPRTLEELGQRNHEEKLRNQRAGKGYFTDDDLRRKADNPEEFWGGAGAKRIEPQAVQTTGQEDER
jgi:hypothetical protein